MADKATLGFKSLRRGHDGEEATKNEPAVTRHTTGMPERPKPGWWPDDPAPAEPGAEANLHVGRGLRLKGEVSSCDRLTVEGDVEATIAARALEITSSGQVRGKAEVETAAIDGHFDGDLVVSGCLTVRKSGRVSGTVVYDALEIEKGGCITGTLSRGDKASAPAMLTPVEEPRAGA